MFYAWNVGQRWAEGASSASLELSSSLKMIMMNGTFCLSCCKVDVCWGQSWQISLWFVCVHHNLSVNTFLSALPAERRRVSGLIHMRSSQGFHEKISMQPYPCTVLQHSTHTHARTGGVGCSADRKWRTEVLNKWKKATPLSILGSDEDTDSGPVSILSESSEFSWTGG